MRHKSYDILRVFASIFIICMHAPIPNEQANGIFLSTLSYISAPGIGLFFMISGALLLPLKTDTFTFLKQRILKIIFPTLFWTLFYFGINIALGKESFEINKILSIPFSAQGNPVLWFMYTLAGLYLISPILSHWLKNSSKKEVEFYLGLWAVSLCYPLLKSFITINHGDTSTFYYFHGYAGYFILGYYCKNYKESLKWKLIIPFFTIALISPIFCKVMKLDVNFYDVFWYLSIFVGILCLSYYNFNEFICEKLKLTEGMVYSIAQELSRLTFGIYLIHIFVMRYLLWKWDLIISIPNYYLQTIMIIVLTFTCSTLSCYLISFLPGAQYIIGYKKRRKTSQSINPHTFQHQ